MCMVPMSNIVTSMWITIITAANAMETVQKARRMYTVNHKVGCNHAMIICGITAELVTEAAVTAADKYFFSCFSNLQNKKKKGFLFYTTLRFKRHQPNEDRR